MSKPREVSVSAYKSGETEVKVWCTSFTLRNPNGLTVEEIQKRVKKVIEQVDIPEE
jgi:hypothetical protein